MKKFSKLRKSLKNIKQVKWLLPGWVFYEYYNLHKSRGNTRRQSIAGGAKAEVIRLLSTASLPVPGTYELTTAGLALLKKKIEEGEVENLNLKVFKDFIPVNKMKVDKEALMGNLQLKFIKKRRKLYFRIFYKKED